MKNVKTVGELASTHLVVTVSISALSLANAPFGTQTAILLASQTLEDLHHELHELLVVVFEGHFSIHTHKLSQVTVSVGTLGPVYWSDTNSLVYWTDPTTSVVHPFWVSVCCCCSNASGHWCSQPPASI